MKGYDSVLFPILQALFEQICNDRFPLRDQALTATDARPLAITQLADFVKKLNNDHSMEGYQKALNDVLNSDIKCERCHSCAHCLCFFYLEIACVKGEDPLRQKAIEQKKLLEEQHGQLSFRRPPSFLQRHFDNHVDMWAKYKESYESRHELSDQEKEAYNSLIVLKGISSSSPFILNGIYASKHFTGGGFFIRYKGLGIVVDPGYGFVENMRNYNICIQDINVVIITHHHIDHNNDMRIIEDMNHQFQEKGNPHIIQWYVDQQTYKLHCNGMNNKENVVHPLSPAESLEAIQLSDYVSFNIFRTEHVLEKSLYSECTFGTIFNFFKSNKSLSTVVGYTSDGRYFDGFEDNFKGVDILIANISGIYYDDYLLINQKKQHLGYRGCYKLLERLSKSLKLLIVSEFWCGTTDLRFDVCKALSQEFHQKYKVIPGDIGLQINLENRTVKCSQCGMFCQIADIKAIKPREDFAPIAYVCNCCTL